MKKVMILLLLAFIGGLGFGVYHSFLGQDLSDIDGYALEKRLLRPPDVPAMIEMAAKTRKPIIITEREINSWLAQNIKVRQEGKLADYVDLKGVWLRFDETEGGRVEIIFEREVKIKDQPPRLHTTSMFVRVERKKKEDGTFTNYIHKDGGHLLGLIAIGGRFGQTRVPQGFLLFTGASLDSFSSLFQTELKWIKEEIITKGGGRVIFEEGKMRIDFPVK